MKQNTDFCISRFNVRYFDCESSVLLRGRGVGEDIEIDRKIYTLSGSNSRSITRGKQRQKSQENRDKDKYSVEFRAFDPPDPITRANISEYHLLQIGNKFCPLDI